MLEFLTSSQVPLAALVALVGIVYTIIQIRRGRSKGWLKASFLILEVPETESLRNIFPYPSGLVLIENHGSFEEFISAMHYSVEGKAFAEVLFYRQMFSRAIDIELRERSYRDQRFDEAVEALQAHSAMKIHAVLGIDSMTEEEWNAKSNAILGELEAATNEIQRAPEDTTLINYPISIPPGGAKRIDFDIPERWESDLDSITCLKIQTNKEVLHVRRGYAKPSSPCNQFKCRIRHHLLKFFHKGYFHKPHKIG